MTQAPPPARPARGARSSARRQTPARLVDVLPAPAQLLKSLLAQPLGQISPSIYETGRLVTLAPWLTDHDRRVEFLLASQRPDGGWGGPGPYGLVPTLSATEALLTELRRTPAAPRALLAATRRGLAMLTRAVSAASPLPDTVAVELIVPVLVEAVNAHLLDASGRTRGGALRGLRATPLPQPSTVDSVLAASVRDMIASGAAVPEKVLHTLELAGWAAHASPVRPVPPGSVGASPAATAAWLGEQPGRRTTGALAYLRAAARPHGGPVPSVVPITMFERAWVLDALLRSRVPVRVPPKLTASIAAGIGPIGTPGGAGLPCDADTSSVAILNAYRLGARITPDPLRHYETRTHFVTWAGERTASTTTNAHVLECLGEVRPATAAAATWQERATAKISRWLCANQLDDGTWTDKWHASPWYATVAAAEALHRFGGRGASAAVGRAIGWLLASQHSDGSWGIWGGTAEETAYALHLLVPLLSRRVPRGIVRAHVVSAAARGLAYLEAAPLDPRVPIYAPLWQDKDLYTPTAVVHAAVLGARHRASEDPEVSAALRPLLKVISTGTRGA